MITILLVVNFDEDFLKTALILDPKHIAVVVDLSKNLLVAESYA